MSLWTPLLWLAIITPLLISAYFKSDQTNVKYLTTFVVYFLVDCYLNSLDFIEPIIPGLRWNWDGKMLSLVLSLGFILFHSKEIRREIGFTRQYHRRTVRLGALLFIGFLLFDFAFKYMVFPKGSEFDLETFIFQATMPGLTEELLFRGIYMWLLGKAFVSSKMIKGVSFGWNFIIVTILFGVAHGMVITEDLEVRYDIETIVYLTLISSFSVGMLRIPNLGAVSSF